MESRSGILERGWREIFRERRVNILLSEEYYDIL
jgi:hypothetical protein